MAGYPDDNGQRAAIAEKALEIVLETTVFVGGTETLQILGDTAHCHRHIHGSAGRGADERGDSFPAQQRGDFRGLILEYEYSARRSVRHLPRTVNNNPGEILAGSAPRSQFSDT